MSTRPTVHVPHLGGIDVSYQKSKHPHNANKPTLVLVHSFMTTSDLYRPQLENEEITKAANLIAIDLLGHGQTRISDQSGAGAGENFTYWDSATMIIQAMQALGVEKYFVLGTSQGGFVAVRMALLAPKKILGLLPLGTSMDFESPRTRTLGCWDINPLGNALIGGWTSPTPTPDFRLDSQFCTTLTTLGFGPDCYMDLRDFWIRETTENYTGDAGRRRARMACINLRDRDGLHERLFDVVCPVLWVQGTADQVYSVANAEEEIKLFVNSKEARLKVVQDGQHFLSASHPKETAEAVLEFLGKYS